MEVKVHDEIRMVLGLDENKKKFFTKKEQEMILDAIGVKYTEVATGMEKIPGWITQKTINSHPTKDNLVVIKGLLEKKIDRSPIAFINGMVQNMDKKFINMISALKVEDDESGEKIIIFLRKEA